MEGETQQNRKASLELDNITNSADHKLFRRESFEEECSMSSG